MNQPLPSARTQLSALFGHFGVAFVVLKLCHVIDWSWWIVLLPLYGPAAVVVVALSVVALVAFVQGFISALNKERHGKKGAP